MKVASTAWYPLVEDAVLVRRLGPRPTMRCACCGTMYPRGSWRCCAPPAGTPSQAWLALACPKVQHGGCGKCWKHCACPNKQERRARPLAGVFEELVANLRPERSAGR